MTSLYLGIYMYIYTYISGYITCIHVATNFKELMNFKEEPRDFGQREGKKMMWLYCNFKKKLHKNKM